MIHASGFSVAPHSYFHFFRVLDFRCVCQRKIQNSVKKMEVWALWRNSSINQGQRMVHSLIYCNQWSCHFGWYRSGILTAGPVVIYPWSSQSLASEGTAEVSSTNITVTNKFNSLTHIMASSLVCTSPLAVITVVGPLNVTMVSNSAKLRSHLADHMHTSPGIHYKLFPPALLLTRPEVPILPRASRMWSQDFLHRVSLFENPVTLSLTRHYPSEFLFIFGEWSLYSGFCLVVHQPYDAGTNTYLLLHIPIRFCQYSSVYRVQIPFH